MSTPSPTTEAGDAFEADWVRDRDRELALLGYRVLRITWRRVRDEPTGAVRTIRTSLHDG